MKKNHVISVLLLCSLLLISAAPLHAAAAAGGTAGAGAAASGNKAAAGEETTGTACTPEIYSWSKTLATPADETAGTITEKNSRLSYQNQGTAYPAALFYAEAPGTGFLTLSLDDASYDNLGYETLLFGVESRSAGNFRSSTRVSHFVEKGDRIWLAVFDYNKAASFSDAFKVKAAFTGVPEANDSTFAPVNGIITFGIAQDTYDIPYTPAVSGALRITAGFDDPKDEFNDTKAYNGTVQLLDSTKKVISPKENFNNAAYLGVEAGTACWLRFSFQGYNCAYRRMQTYTIHIEELPLTGAMAKSDAVRLSSGASAVSCFQLGGSDDAWYKVVVKKSGRHTFRLSTLTAGKCSFSILKGNRVISLRSSVKNGTTYGRTLTKTGWLAKGTYYVKVTRSSASVTGRYSIRFR